VFFEFVFAASEGDAVSLVCRSYDSVRSKVNVQLDALSLTLWYVHLQRTELYTGELTKAEPVSNPRRVGFSDKYLASTAHGDIQAIVAPAVLEILDGPQTQLKISFIHSLALYKPLHQGRLKSFAETCSNRAELYDLQSTIRRRQRHSKHPHKGASRAYF